jgi:hypothetical protein
MAAPNKKRHELDAEGPISAKAGWTRAADHGMNVAANKTSPAPSTEFRESPVVAALKE